MTSIEVKKNVEELTKRIEQVKTNIVKINEQLEQMKSDEAQLFGAVQYANSIYNVLVKEEEVKEESADAKD